MQRITCEGAQKRLLPEQHAKTSQIFADFKAMSEKFAEVRRRCAEYNRDRLKILETRIKETGRRWCTYSRHFTADQEMTLVYDPPSGTGFTRTRGHIQRACNYCLGRDFKHRAYYAEKRDDGFYVRHRSGSWRKAPEHVGVSLSELPGEFSKEYAEAIAWSKIGPPIEFGTPSAYPRLPTLKVGDMIVTPD